MLWKSVFSFLVTIKPYILSVKRPCDCNHTGAIFLQVAHIDYAAKTNYWKLTINLVTEGFDKAQLLNKILTSVFSSCSAVPDDLQNGNQPYRDQNKNLVLSN